MSLYTKIGVCLFALVPAITFGASSAVDTSYISSLLTAVGNIINILIPILVGLCVLAIMWGLFQYLKGGAEEKEKGRAIMIWGVVAVAVMVSIYGLVGILQSTFGITGTETITPPSVTVPTL